MSILDLINNKEEWKSFYNYKIEKGHLNKKELKKSIINLMIDCVGKYSK